MRKNAVNETDPNLSSFTEGSDIGDAGSSGGSTIVDSTVLEALRNGDHSAFKITYLYYVNPLQRFVTSLTGSFEDAEEVVQTVFIKLWEIRERIDPSRNIKSYLFAISRNAALDFLRARRPSGAIEGMEALEDDYRPDSGMIASETQRLIDVAVENMPKKRREVFNLYLQGLSHQEIADKLDITEGNVRQYILRARNDIKGLMGVIAFFLMSGGL